MTWFTVEPQGATRDLWLHPVGEDSPRYGRWYTPSGIDVKKELGRLGPDGVDVDVWWVPPEGHYGKRMRDFIWTTNRSALKIVSERMVAVLRGCGANLETFVVDIRMHSGPPLAGYLGVLEERWEAGPVHSSRLGERNHAFIVSADVVAAIEVAGLHGLEISPAKSAFLKPHRKNE